MRDMTAAYIKNGWRIERGEHAYWLVKYTTLVELQEPQLDDAASEGQHIANLYDAAERVLDELDADGAWWEVPRAPAHVLQVFGKGWKIEGYLFAFDPTGGVPAWMPKKWRADTHVGDWKVVLV